MLKKPSEWLRRAVSPSRNKPSRHKKSASSSSSVSNVPNSSQIPAINNPHVTVTVTPAPAKITDLAFLEALKQYEKTLSNEELVAFRSASANSPQELIQIVQGLDEKHRSSSISRPIAPRIQKLLMGMNQFMTAVGVFTNADPAISALVVGAMMIVMQLAVRFFEFFEKLTDMMELLGQHLSYLSKYAVEAFQGSEDVQDALARAYGDLLDFYAQARRVFVDTEGNVSRWTSFKLFLNLTWQPFEASFTDIQAKFMRHADIVVREAQVQGMIIEYSERERRKLREDMKDRKEKEDERYTILKWLGDIDFEDVHQRNFEKRFGGTGQWFLDHNRFKEWDRALKSGLLWCHGTAGTGKTVLCSLVLERISQKYALSDNTGIAFAYCNYKEPLEPATYIAILIKQLSRIKKNLPTELERLYKSHRANARNASCSDLQQLFIAVAKYFDRVFVVLDALDECPEERRTELLKFLTTITSSERGAPGNVKLFITSRKEKDIERAFADVPTIQIEAEKVAADIESYIRFELDRRLKDGTLKLRDPKLGLEEKILDVLLGKAGGMFLWVKFQLDDICSQKSDHAILQALESLPENIEETYNNIILKIDKKPRAERILAREILMWVAYAARPLSINELSHAIATELDIDSVGELEDRIPIDYIDICLGLIVADPSSSHCDVRFSHYSVQEYLVTKKDIEDPSVAHVVRNYMVEPHLANQKIAEICVKYLTLFSFGYSYSFYPKLSYYAIRYFPHHVRTLEGLEPRLWELIYNFISSGDRFYEIMRRHSTANIPKDINLPLSLIAIILDMPLVIERLVEGEAQTDPKKSYPSVLHWAAQQSSYRGIEWLCAHGYDVNQLDEDGLSPLYHATKNGEKELVVFLLEKGASIGTYPQYTEGILNVAAMRPRDSLEITQLLLNHGAGVNIESGYFGYPLQAAAYHAKKEVMLLLLANGAKVDAKGGVYGCALQAAAGSYNLDGSLEVVRLLLDHGADISVESKHYGNPLHAAAYRANKEVVKLLLANGAKVNAQGGEYGCPLQAAAASEHLVGSLEVVRLLLDHGADVNIRGGCYGDPLEAATACQNKEIVQLLLEKGAKVVGKQSQEYVNTLQAGTTTNSDNGGNFEAI